MTAIPNLSILRSISRFRNNIDELLCAVLQICERAPRHAAGAVQDEDDIRRIGQNIRLRSQRKFDSERSSAIDAGDV